VLNVGGNSNNEANCSPWNANFNNGSSNNNNNFGSLVSHFLSNNLFCTFLFLIGVEY